jgi:hypothetical protein
MKVIPDSEIKWCLNPVLFGEPGYGENTPQGGALFSPHALTGISALEVTLRL